MAKEIPIFRVTMAPGFATGMYVHPPGSELPWEVPEDWNEKKFGKHYASHGPSTTFECVNEAARERMAEHLATIKKKNTPPSSEMQELKAMNAKLQEQIITMMNSLMESKASERRTKG